MLSTNDLLIHGLEVVVVHPNSAIWNNSCKVLQTRTIKKMNTLEPTASDNSLSPSSLLISASFPYFENGCYIYAVLSKHRNPEGGA